jgi:ADP-ribose pyrophosphatase YjhB (NUDIX family)
MTGTSLTRRTSTETDVATVVVAVVLEWRGRIALFRRSQAVRHDRGLWHCVTGYVEHGVSPERQALDELFEETGLGIADLARLQAGGVLSLRDSSGQIWWVHTFRAVTVRRKLTLNWEHDAYRWTAVRKVARFDGQVDWLRQVIQASKFDAAQM